MNRNIQKSKHAKDEEKRKIGKKNIIFFSVIFLILVIAGATIFILKKTDNDIPIISNILPPVSNGEDNSNELEENIVDVEIEDKMSNYNVLGVLKIDKLNLEKSILDTTTDDSLKLSVTKFYGPDLNEIGNFVITGHNYKSIFAYLDRLEKGDTFDIIDKAKTRKITYRIYDKYIVNPEDLDCLSQETNNQKEVTLITCTPGGITRIIVKAKEI